MCQTRWDVSDKGRQLYLFKKRVGAKKLDFKYCTHQNTLLQLQNGHCKLKDHMHRVGLAESPGCECGMAETIEHYLLECPLQGYCREKLINNISLSTNLDRKEITVQALLSPDEIDIESIHRHQINKELDDFVIGSKKVSTDIRSTIKELDDFVIGSKRF